ncbi:MAG: hypothetical protein ABIL09_02830, partial [Gemmatimonadota bacterium]
MSFGCGARRVPGRLAAVGLGALLLGLAAPAAPAAGDDAPVPSLAPADTAVTAAPVSGGARGPAPPAALGSAAAADTTRPGGPTPRG